MNIGKAHFELPTTYVDIPGVSYDIDFVWRRKEYIRDRSTLTMGLIDEIAEEWSGVRVYLNGFRVYPYGEPGDDWLDIDKDVARRLTKADDVFKKVSENLVGVDHSRAMLHLPRNENLVGRVIIQNYPKKTFDVTVNREGIIENEAFKHLKQFIRRGIEWATIYYQYFLVRAQQEEVRRTAQELKEQVAELEIPREQVPEVVMPIVQSALNLMEESVKLAAEGPSLDGLSADKVYKNASKARQVVETSISHLEKQLNVLRTSASAGALMFTFVHEARTVIGRLDTHASTLERLARGLGERQKQQFLKLAADLRATVDRFDNQVKLIQGVSVDLTETKRHPLRLKKTLEEVVSCFAGLTERFNITVDYSKVPDMLKTGPMLEAEVYSILINLVSNAVKAVIAGDGHRIKIEAVEEKGERILRVSDDGIGVDEDSRGQIGMPLVSDPEGRLYKRLREKLQSQDFLVLGEGSGLGLSIVKDILASYGKSFDFRDPAAPWKTCVEVTLP